MQRAQDDELLSRPYPVEEHMRFQRSLWRFERVSWMVLGAVVLLTLLGFFANGVLSYTHAVGPNGHLTIDYQRFARNGRSNQMTLEASGGSGPLVWISLEGDFLEQFDIENMQPRPAVSRSRGDGLDLGFTRDRQGKATVHLSVRATGVGPAHSTVRTPADAPLPLHQFVYP